MAHSLFADDTAMLNRLEQHIPQLQTDGTTLLITAENPMVAELIQRHTPKLQQQLQTTFIQPSLHINVTVRTQEKRPKHLTQHQQFNKMCKENEALEKLQQVFQLEIQ